MSREDSIRIRSNIKNLIFEERFKDLSDKIIVEFPELYKENEILRGYLRCFTFIYMLRKWVEPIECIKFAKQTLSKIDSGFTLEVFDEDKNLVEVKVNDLMILFKKKRNSKSKLDFLYSDLNKELLFKVLNQIILNEVSTNKEKTQNRLEFSLKHLMAVYHKILEINNGYADLFELKKK